MSFADRRAVENRFRQLGAASIRLRTRTKVMLDVVPGIARALAEGSTGFETRMHHAVLATRITATTLFIDAIFCPINLLRKLGVSRVMPVRHHVTRRLPTTDIVGGNGPGAARQLAFASEELEVTRRAEDSELLTPFLNTREFLAGHFASEEEILRILAEAFNHVLFGCVVIVAGRNGVAITTKPGEEFEHLLDLKLVGLFVNRCVGRHLMVENLRHFDGFDAFLEHTFALDDKIVSKFQS